MMNERVELTDEAIELVNGGDYGDADKDTGTKPRYSVGQEVELYNSPFHVTTSRIKIYETNFAYGCIANFTKHWWYRISSDASLKPVWVTASDIEG